MKKIFALTLSLMLGTLLSTAQEVPASLSLSLREAQLYAIEHNRTIANASLDVRSAEANRWSAIASMLPQISASGSYQDMFGYEMNFGAGKMKLPSSMNVAFTASMALSGSQVVSALMSKISKDMADITVSKTEQSIGQNVKLMYVSALVTTQTLALLRESLVEMEKLLNYTQVSVNAGVSEQVDADQLEVQVATMINSISSAERQLEMVYNSIRIALCVESTTEITLTDPLERLYDIDEVMSLLTEDFLIERNMDYQLLQKSVALSKRQIAATGWGFGPNLSVAFQNSFKKTFGDGFNMTPPNSLQVSLNIPIFTSLRATKSIQAAKYNYQKQLNTLKDTETSLYVQHRQYKFNLNSTHERLLTQKKGVEVSKRVFDNIGKKYEFGHASALEVTNANTALITAQSNYVSAVFEFVSAQIDLETLLNKEYLAN
ncbi:MAG: TolC family protein [Bacteroidales bacterium]|nr:TolC family protein [Bacteroidales bacterium]